MNCSDIIFGMWIVKAWNRLTYITLIFIHSKAIPLLKSFDSFDYTFSIPDYIRDADISIQMLMQAMISIQYSVQFSNTKIKAQKITILWQI